MMRISLTNNKMSIAVTKVGILKVNQGLLTMPRYLSSMETCLERQVDSRTDT